MSSSDGITEQGTLSTPGDIATYAAARMARASTGDLAELRRIPIRGYANLPGIFWDIVLSKGVRPAQEIFWADVLSMMAATPSGGARIGKSLADGGVSSRHLERWLRLNRDEARVECRKLLTRVDAVHWPDLAKALFWWGEDNRKDIARDYFRGLPKT